MKKRFFVLILAAVLAAAMAGSALGVGGTTDDPVVSLSYLEDVFTPELEKAWQQTVHDGLGSAARDAMLDAVETTSMARLEARQAASSVPQKANGTLLLQKGDLITASPGCKVTVKNGTLLADTSYLIDVTNGRAVTKNTTLSPKTLYMMGDTTSGELRVQTATCEITLSGTYCFTPATGPDYGSLALALGEMGLFQGTGTGYVMENTANRAQGLVMFLRILGLEDEALAYKGTCPFTDVPADHWARPYVAYAYAKGLTTGTSATRFSPDGAITCQHYATFLMRALHYVEGTDFTYKTAVQDLRDLGLCTAAETATLSSGAFNRYKMVYLSFYGLFSVDQQDGGLLMTRLVDDGAVTSQELAAGLALAEGGRIS